LLPTGFALGFGKIIGTLAYYFDIRHKAVAYDNISFVFPERSISERKRMVKNLFQNFALNLIELLRMPVINSGYFDKYIEIEGRENIEQALKQGNGIIFLAVHFGSWELSNIICSKLGLTYKVLAREQKRFSKLNELLNSYRQSQGTVVVTRGITTREIVKSLHNNEVVGLVADQGGKDGLLIPFFGRDASMPTGAIRLALKLDAPVLIAFIIRKHGPYHKVIIKPQLNIIKTDNQEQDILNNVKQVVKVAEDMIKVYPEQYMWFYKIWKYSQTRSIVILSDNKAGHLRQSQSVANLLTAQLNSRGVIATIKTVNLNFKNNLSKNMVVFSSFWAKRRHCKGCLWCLNNFLDKKSFLELNKVSADFVISCGQALAAVNFILSSEKSAKSITILNPGILGFSRFDLVLMPEHDKPTKRKNIVMTKGAPNLITQDYLAREKESLINSFPDLSAGFKRKIGLLLGGDTKKYALTKEITGRVLKGIRNICEEQDLELLITTSRRTSKEVEEIVKKEAAGFKGNKLLIIANENNHPAAVGGILAISDIIVVSGESISMVSEAASSGKIVLVFRLKPRFNFNTQQDKHEMFLENLAKQGFIYLVEPENVEGILKDYILNRRQAKPLNDNAVISEAIDKII
jgi:Lauroyl/myristoyl acyltransferase